MRHREPNSRLSANNEPALTVRDAARYRAVLLAKRDELAAAGAEGAESLVPPANDKSGDLIDWARADTEAELQFQRRQSDAHLMRAIEDALVRMNHGSFVHSAFAKSATSRFRGRGLRQYRGRAGAVIAKKSRVRVQARGWRYKTASECGA